tara:strand:+ start:4760 stop:5200 length:441 start_codon:yes stop_codon:yes gene_type:complete
MCELIDSFQLIIFPSNRKLFFLSDRDDAKRTQALLGAIAIRRARPLNELNKLTLHPSFTVYTVALPAIESLSTPHLPAWASESRYKHKSSGVLKRPCIPRKKNTARAPHPLFPTQGLADRAFQKILALDGLSHFRVAALPDNLACS